MKFNKKGVSVVEVCIAAFILAIAFVALTRLINYSTVSSVKIGNKAKASDIMAMLMEEVKHVPFKAYAEDMPKLFTEKDFVDIPANYYSDTTKQLELLKKDDKEYWINELKACAICNDNKQIVELAIKCEIQWKEKGKKEDNSQKTESLRDYALIYNSEAKLN